MLFIMPITLFYKVLILFWGVLEHALMLGGSKITLLLERERARFPR